MVLLVGQVAPPHDLGPDPVLDGTPSSPAGLTGAVRQRPRGPAGEHPLAGRQAEEPGAGCGGADREGAPLLMGEGGAHSNPKHSATRLS